MSPPAPQPGPDALSWELGGTSRIPFAVYTDEQRHRRELERFFYKGHWSYVGLEAEIPNAGDFKRTVVGERSVITVSLPRTGAVLAMALASGPVARRLALLVDPFGAAEAQVKQAVELSAVAQDPGNLPAMQNQMAAR